MLAFLYLGRDTVSSNFVGFPVLSRVSMEKMLSGAMRCLLSQIDIVCIIDKDHKARSHLTGTITVGWFTQGCDLYSFTRMTIIEN